MREEAAFFARDVLVFAEGRVVFAPVRFDFADFADDRDAPDLRAVPAVFLPLAVGFLLPPAAPVAPPAVEAFLACGRTGCSGRRSGAGSALEGSSGAASGPAGSSADGAGWNGRDCRCSKRSRA